MMKKDSKIYIAGHKGLVGSAILRLLKKHNYSNLIYKSSKELDLKDTNAVSSFFERETPEFVFLAAAKVGGILANNNYPADFIYDNLMIQTNVIHSSYEHNVKRLLFLGSSCIYPKLCPQPMKEEHLLSGSLEPTNEPYAIAKIAGIKMVDSYNRQYGTDYISLMPTNLYGPNDNYDLENSHVLPALIRKFHEAKISQQDTVTIWGTGQPRREFLHVDDLANASLFLIDNYSENNIVNVGVGKDISIKELAETIQTIVGFKGKLIFDTSKPDGTMQKLCDTSKINSLGWNPSISLTDGIKQTYNAFVSFYEETLCKS